MGSGPRPDCNAWSGDLPENSAPGLAPSLSPRRRASLRSSVLFGMSTFAILRTSAHPGGTPIPGGTPAARGNRAQEDCAEDDPNPGFRQRRQPAFERPAHPQEMPYQIEPPPRVWGTAVFAWIGTRSDASAGPELPMACRLVREGQTHAPWSRGFFYCPENSVEEGDRGRTR